jgi:glutamate-1-semialdehyde 2,1-aminomutase
MTTEAAVELIPGGAMTLSKMRGRFPGVYPRSLYRGSGARVFEWRLTGPGRGFVDWICGLGAVSLGYRDEAVEGAVIKQVMDGPIFSLPNVELEERVAQRLVDLIPCAESVRFFKTGSEATEAAIRVARAHTGRDVVLCCGYHGWHSWYAVTRPEHPGVPEAMTELSVSFEYNDLAALDRDGADDIFGNFSTQDIAAVIVEPTLIEPPSPGFLEGLRERCDRWGALLIFDEMVTGFRWHAGGYQALCGVTPDLATFGKALANGYALAALVGRAEPMRWARLASGTFGGDLIGLAAADATLARYQQGGVCEHMAWLGARIIEGYNALAEKHGAPTRAVGQPPHPVIRWDEEMGAEGVPRSQKANGGHQSADAGRPYRSGSSPQASTTPPNRHRASLFFQETVRRGHLIHPEGMNLMLAHTDADVDALLGACDEAMAIVIEAIAAGDVRARVEGDPIDPAPAWRITR